MKYLSRFIGINISPERLIPLRGILKKERNARAVKPLSKRKLKY